MHKSTMVYPHRYSSLSSKDLSELYKIALIISWTTAWLTNQVLLVSNGFS